MKTKRSNSTWTFPLLLTILLVGALPANGQLGNLLAAALGGTTTTSTTAATPAATPAASATPSSTPAASATPSATPASTPAASTSATPVAAAATTAAAAGPATPATAAATTTTAAAATTPSSLTTANAPDASANPPAVVVLLPGVAAALNSSSLNSTALNTTGSTPLPTSVPPPAPPPVVPIVINAGKLVSALPADETQPLNSTSSNTSTNSTGAPGLTAADMVIQVSGSGVTPFDVPQQTILLRAAASVLTTVSLSDLRIRYVTSAASITSSGRKLLAAQETGKAQRHLLDTATGVQAAALQGDLYDVATVTLEANCSSASAVPATLTEMQNIMQNSLLASALQSYNATSWGMTLYSLTSTDPSVFLDTKTPCKKKMGVFCLDNTSLSVSAAETIIGIGCFVVIMLLCIPCVWLEWRRRSGRMVELDPTPETPKSPMQKVQAMYNNMVNTVKQASPMHRKGSNARTAFQETPRAETLPAGAKPNAKPTINLHASSQR